VKVRSHESGEWGLGSLYGHLGILKNISLRKSAFRLESRLLASLLIHESVHTHQWIPGESNFEPLAYQTQSDFLGDLKIKIESVLKANQYFGHGNNEFIQSIAGGFARYKVQNPSILDK
jgi:hypothetical protein